MNKILILISLCFSFSYAGILDKFNFGLTYQFYLDPSSPDLSNSQHQLGLVTTFEGFNKNLYFCLETGTNSWVIYNIYKDYTKNNETHYYSQIISGGDSLHIIKQIYYKENSNGFYLSPYLVLCYKNFIVTAGEQFDINQRSYSYVDSIDSYSHESIDYFYNYNYRRYSWNNYWRTSLSFRYSIGYKLKHFVFSIVSYDFLQRVGLSLTLLLKPI